MLGIQALCFFLGFYPYTSLTEAEKVSSPSSWHGVVGIVVASLPSIPSGVVITQTRPCRKYLIAVKMIH